MSTAVRGQGRMPRRSRIKDEKNNLGVSHRGTEHHSVGIKEISTAE